ncbi:MAG: 2-C-methyl-D-erythritol 4-phosphate cytidylyltransferase [Planctomycetes bacterium]|nr:2-C-methyl-D-erythritol 4-phosphate cytidylyltransferase [Planctomycetota bacterium]MBU1518455.1 2-C-methyl-D-erythritol 4-phosphate cytidylyltransferase [Planctomycetota bacterium]MBU2458027.1 2-C-methyl-D-erythritol 4-phosphate cytidylyltransferase [Planctomycetota bacterium]MBU2596501.1 2-C-methyl-D-erythritol 4-phosphate cytidylyltransferase [Planctomycetota bacterium]
MNVAVIICAGGSSQRFVKDQKHNLESIKKKQFADVGGRPAFLRSVEFFADRDDVKQIILSIPAEDEEMFKITHGANLSFHGVKLCLGGAERFETVAKALELVKDDIDLVAVHDAVRCCLTEKWLDDAFKTAEKTGAAMLACPVVATLKRVENGQIMETVDRTGLYEAQTPQVFKKDLLKKAYANLGKLDKSKISDDSQLVEALGQKVSIVETDSSNIKITTKADIAIAETIIKSRLKSKPKGYVGPYGDAQW